MGGELAAQEVKGLPAVTYPWREKIGRRHMPRPVSGRQGYQKFLPCLRWEFGFSCAFCLCHEADFTRSGARRLGIMQVEHFLLQSLSSDQRNLYSNCFLICRLCNIARGTAWDSVDGNVLLNPCSQVWGDEFELVDDEMQPKDAGNGNAIYTRDVYDLNGPHKVRMRRLRRETIEKALAFLRRSDHLEQALLDRAIATGDPVLIDAAKTIRDYRREALWDLQQFVAIPHDRDQVCLCGHQTHHSLPRVLAEQTIDIGHGP
jgi:hypothetical protein